MMNIKLNPKYPFLIIAVIVIVFVLAISKIQSSGFSVKDYIETDKSLGISPDYSDTVIPPNIAPLNFYIKEPASRYYVKIYSKKGRPINISSKLPGIRIPLKRWERLLNENKGNDLYVEIFIKKAKEWRKYKPIVNRIAEEKIDSFLVYRYLAPYYYRKLKLKIYQRNLENFNKKLIVDSKTFQGCFNCHTFFKKKPQKFIIQGRRGGRNYMILNNNNKISLIGPRLKTLGSSYLSWHPSGDIVALTMDMDYEIVDRFFGKVPEEKLQYIDTDGNLAIYNIATNTLTTTPSIAQEERIEMQPEWSPDGKYLYFISAPKLPIAEYAKIKYDLMRISYDTEKDTWGKLETVISSQDTGLGVSFPKFSPDGRYLLFNMADRSSLTIYRSSTDLYLMDTRTDKYRKLEINSERTDCYHSWSSNSRWFVFISKRGGDGIFGKPYFCYIDDEGKVYKPFILPQKEPYFYDGFAESYNVPELISESVEVNRFTLGRKITAAEEIIEPHVDQDLIDGYTDF